MLPTIAKLDHLIDLLSSDTPNYNQQLWLCTVDVAYTLETVFDDTAFNALKPSTNTLDLVLEQHNAQAYLSGSLMLIPDGVNYTLQRMGDDFRMTFSISGHEVTGQHALSHFAICIAYLRAVKHGFETQSENAL